MEHWVPSKEGIWGLVMNEVQSLSESSQSDEGGRLKNKMSSSRTQIGTHRVLWYNPDWGYQGGLPGEGGV